MYRDPTEAMLYQAVLAQPAADEPRERIAEWYEARNDVRGQFILLQLSAARAQFDQQRREARLAASALLDQHRAAWSSDLPPYVTLSRFVRGFIEMITLDAAQFLREAAALYAIAPIRFLVLTDAKPVIHDLARSPHLARIVKLSLSGCGLSDGDVATLVQSPHLGHLEALELAHNDIGIAGLEALCAAPTLPRLAYLNFTGNRIDSPVEKFDQHWETGAINPYSIELPALGKQLEAKYGTKAWIHGPSLLRNYPPDYEDL